jgi:hypothetical protein
MKDGQFQRADSGRPLPPLSALLVKLVDMLRRHGSEGEQTREQNLKAIM